MNILICLYASLEKLIFNVQEACVSRYNGATIKGPSIRWWCDVRGISGDPQLVPHDAEKHQSLGQLYV